MKLYEIVETVLKIHGHDLRVDEMMDDSKPMRVGGFPASGLDDGSILWMHRGWSGNLTWRSVTNRQLFNFYYLINVGGLEIFFIFPYIGNNHPIDQYLSEGLKPSTSN